MCFICGCVEPFGLHVLADVFSDVVVFVNLGSGFHCVSFVVVFVHLQSGLVCRGSGLH